MNYGSLAPSVVALRREPDLRYPLCGPFNPSTSYPEYCFHPAELQYENRVYGVVRELFALLGLDHRNLGSKDWNPFGSFIAPGDKVVIKPNFVTDLHRLWPRSVSAQLALFTHGSVLRPVIDYSFKACGEQGQIVVCDCPLEEPREDSFRNVSWASGVQTMVEYLVRRGVPLRLMDLRDGLHSSTGSIKVTKTLSGDPLGYTEIELGRNSLIDEISSDSARFETGNWKKVGDYHSPGHHLYSIANTVLDCDVFINVPKLKTHKKTGLTLCLKNLMGISNRKDWIPHWRRGVDEHSGHDTVLEKLVKSAYGIEHGFWQRLLAKSMDRLGVSIRGYGNWSGNDTIWRAQVDLNKILFFADRSGVLQLLPQRRYFAVVDGIIAGEGDSPLAPLPRLFGAVLAGRDPVAVSRVGASLMGIDYRFVKKITRAAALGSQEYRFSECSPDAVRVVGDEVRRSVEAFQMASGWECLAE